MASLAQFNRDINKFIRNAERKDWPRFKKRIAHRALVILVRNTPKKTGRAKGSWVVSLRRASGQQFRPETAIQRDSVAAGDAVIAGIKGNESIFFRNNVPYFAKLEAGASTQAPNGIVEPTVLELGSLFRAN